MPPLEPPARPKLKPCGPVVRAEEFNHWREAARAVDAAHQYLKSMQELAQAAYEQERRRGFLEGREAGSREAAQLATNLAGEATRYLSEIERAVPSMIMVIVEHILGTFDEVEFVTRAVHQAVTTLAGSEICLRVAPEMVEPLRRSLDEDGSCDARLLRVEADAGIHPGDCQIVTKAVGTLVHAVVPNVRIGELCTIADAQAGHSINAEVVGFTSKGVLLTPIGGLHGLSMRSEVIPTGQTMTTPVGDALLGRVIDSLGRALDGGAPINRRENVRSLHGPAPNPLSRQMIDRSFSVGLRAIDGLLSCGEGQRVGIYGEPGSGKSWLLAQIVKNADADVAVIGLIGERGREVREFITRQLGEAGLKRAVLVVATSDRSPIERLKAAYAATAIAEHFRDSGRRVLLLIDSITRFARAAREIGLAAGEPPTRRGFPPSVFANLPKLMERVGMSDK